MPLPPLGPLAFSSHWKVNFPKKVKSFALQVLHGRWILKIVSRSFPPWCCVLNSVPSVREWKILTIYFGIVKLSSMVFRPQQCALRRRVEDLHHLLWDCEFVTSLWNRFFRSVGLVLAHNRGCCLMFEELLLNPHFHDKGRVLWQIWFLLCCEAFSLRRKVECFVGSGGQERIIGMWLGSTYNSFGLEPLSVIGCLELLFFWLVFCIALVFSFIVWSICVKIKWRVNYYRTTNT